jgi:spore germination protein KC
MNGLSLVKEKSKRKNGFIKRIVKIMFFFILPFLLGGCTHDMSRKEIDEIDLILVVAIDYEDGEYTLSALHSSGGGADPEEGSGATEEVAKGTGKSAYEALEDLKLKNKKSISLAQAGSFLIGEEAAKQGLDQSLDFLSRDETIKMEALIYVTKGKKAADFVQEGIDNKQTIHEDLDAMKQKQQEILTRNDNTMVNILNDMKQTDSCVLVPYLLADESGYLIDGYSVFNELTLVNYLDHETSDGVNFIRNIMRSYPIYLDNGVGLYISYTNTKLKAKLENQQVTVTVTVSFESMLKEVLTKKDVFTRDELDQLTLDQNNYIQSIIEKPVQYSIDSGLDILNLARLVENQNFTQWKSIKDSWADEIPDIKYQYKIQSRISKSFLLGAEGMRQRL